MIPRYSPARHGGAVQRRGPLRHVARGRAAGHRGAGRARAWSRPRTPRPAGPRPRRSTRSSCTTCSSARRSPTTTWPPSSTSSRSASARRPARYIHYGLTSSDVVDTALCATLTKAADLLLGDLDAFVDALEGPCPRAARRAGDRSHPRDACRADHLRGQVRPVGAAGRPGPRAACGPPARRSRSASSPARSAPTPTSTRRSRPRCAPPSGSTRSRPPRSSPGTATPSSSTPAPRSVRRSSSCAPRSATWPAARWARPKSPSAPARRAARPCRTSATPSSPSASAAWPACSAATWAPGLEDVALWHERDISHSSVERVALPDASLLACYLLRKATGLAAGLVIHPERARENLTEGSLGLVFSQSVLLALVSAGLTRDEAYRIVQRDARAAWSERRPVPPGPRSRRRGHA